jgi:hypothetical protein
MALIAWIFAHLDLVSQLHEFDWTQRPWESDMHRPTNLRVLGFLPGGRRAGSRSRSFLSVSLTDAESAWTRLREEVGGLRRDVSRGGSVGGRTEPS